MTAAPPTIYAVTVNSAGMGASGGGNYAQGVTVAVSAGTPPTGQQFKNWTASPTVTFANANSASTTFTMPASAVTVTANFEPISATVTGVTASPTSIEVQQGGTQQFAATVQGTNNPPRTVAWSVAGGTGTTNISATGLLTVDPAQTSGSALTVTATSTYDTSKSGTATVTVTSTSPSVVYAVSLDTGDCTFPVATEGYGAQTPLSVAVTNTGNKATGPLSITLSGTDAGSFTLSTANIVDIAIGGSSAFTVTPDADLTAGAYAATVTVSGGNGISKDFGVSFTVTAAPTIYTITFNANSGTVSPASAQTGADGKLPSLPTPTRSGSYSFDGWFTAASGGTAITTATVFTQSATIYAHWTYTGGSPSGGNSGGSSPATPPTSPGTTVGDGTVSTPAGQAPVKNPDGSATLPGGGTVTVGSAGSGNTTANAPTVTVTAPRRHSRRRGRRREHPREWKSDGYNSPAGRGNRHGRRNDSRRSGRHDH
jgi:hypothetical protein